jgi:hypothetical protein
VHGKGDGAVNIIHGYWRYKGVQYHVTRHSFDILSQDAETGQWGSTVFYDLSHDGKPQAKTFCRAATEFRRKFEDLKLI